MQTTPALTATTFSILAFATSWLLTAHARRYALASGLVDVPGPRSSHVLPTPRGGGIAIVITMCLAFPIMAGVGGITWHDSFGIGGAGLIVGLVGFHDDRNDLRASVRLVAHFIAAWWVVGWVGAVPSSVLSGHVSSVPLVAPAATVVYIVWLLNLTNFMDGIDGLATVESITVCASGAIISALTVPTANQWLLPVVLAAACLGFLWWNWPPARVFLGDTGSGFLGLTLAGLSLQAAQLRPEAFWSWSVLLGVFIVDATVTLLRRLLRGARIHQAHRSHAYQYAAAQLKSHRAVTLGVAAINILWLLPVAVVIALGHLEGPWGLMLAYIPLLAIAFWFRAGAAVFATGTK